MQLCPEAQTGFADLGDAHLPPGRVDLEDVLRLGIRDFDLEPRRDDWRDVRAEAQGSNEA